MVRSAHCSIQGILESSGSHFGDLVDLGGWADVVEEAGVGFGSFLVEAPLRFVSCRLDSCRPLWVLDSCQHPPSYLIYIVVFRV